jgi:hypothetical protein
MMVSETTVIITNPKRFESEHQDSLESQGSFEYSQDSLSSQKSGYFSENSSSGVESDDYVSVSQVQAEQKEQTIREETRAVQTVRKPASVVISGIRLDHRSYREGLQISPSTPKVGFYDIDNSETIAEDDEYDLICVDIPAATSSPIDEPDTLAHECRSYFEQRRKKVQEWSEKWSSHDSTPGSTDAPAASLSEKLRCLRLEMVRESR